MAPMGEHEQKTAHRDHLWVAVIIAALALLEVWATWLGLGSVSGFPKLGRMTTGWVLPVTTEAYWAYALYSWLAGAPGPRSRKFAMWTAGAMFLLSLAGQESGHLTSPAGRTPPALVIAFVTALPLISLALIAILVHLRQADREEGAARARAAERAQREAAIERAEADERAALRAQLAAEQDAHAEALAGMEAQLAEAQRARAEAQKGADLRAEAERERDAACAAQDEALRAQEEADEARKDAERRAAKAEGDAARLARKLGSGAAPGSAGRARRNAAATTVPSDVDARAEALALYLANPDISGASLGLDVGMSKRWGQDRKKEFESRTAEGGNRSAENSAAD